VDSPNFFLLSSLSPDPIIYFHFVPDGQALLKHSTEAMKESRVFEILTSVCYFLMHLYCKYAIEILSNFRNRSVSSFSNHAYLP
jgi:hypothetical protein